MVANGRSALKCNKPVYFSADCTAVVCNLVSSVHGAGILYHGCGSFSHNSSLEVTNRGRTGVKTRSR